MSDLYAMQRANGDWFALDDHGDFRVPVFHSNDDAMQARAFNGAMLLFRPVMLDDQTIRNLTSSNETNANFWLVDHAAVNLKRGHPIEQARLSALVGKPDAGKGNQQDG